MSIYNYSNTLHGFNILFCFKQCTLFVSLVFFIVLQYVLLALNLRRLVIVLVLLAFFILLIRLPRLLYYFCFIYQFFTQFTFF